METLTEREMDVLTGMMLCFMHCAERIVYIIEQHYEDVYRRSQDYKKLCKRYGRAKADELLHGKVRDIIHNNEKMQVHRILKQIKDLHYSYDTLTQMTIQAHIEGETEASTYDALHTEVNRLCRFYAQMVNCTGADAEMQLESTIKLLAKGKSFSERIIQMFN